MSERRYKNPQVNLRLPEHLKEHIATMAERNKRSANAEMVAAIEAWVNSDKNPYPDSDEATIIITKKEMKDMIDEIMDNSLRDIIKKFDITPKVDED